MFWSSGCRVKAEQQSSSGSRKKVTFDPNVKIYEYVLPEKETGNLPENNEGAKKKNKDENSVKSIQSQSSSVDSSITSSSGCYPPNHRYHNCKESDDELDYEDGDLDDEDENEDDDGELDYDDMYDDDNEDDDGELDYDDMYDDDNEDDDGELDYDDMYDDDSDGIVETRIAGGKPNAKEVAVDSSVVTRSLDEEGVKPIIASRRARDRSAYVHSVLNPIANLSQWKAVKAKGKRPLKQQKDFTADQEPQRASFSLEPGFKELPLSFNSKSGTLTQKANQEIAVDARLSNRLSSSEATPINKSGSTVSLNTTPQKIMQGSPNSSRSPEDRPILGALTHEEIKQFSASSSPRKSPSRSPEEMSIIGTVGTYWSPTSSAKDSGSVASCPEYNKTLETRLERALNRGSAGTYSTHKANVN